MKKIVITGGLGYIGTELCKIYSGYSWNDQITVIDNRFISSQVSQLRDWNINFVHGDILDKELVNKYLKDADVVHHLAGITDVPRTKSESTKEKDELINLVGEQGTQNILNAISTKCKIIFPSTHVVYEGINQIKTDIKEEDNTCPVLSYSSSKNINEKQLKYCANDVVYLHKIHEELTKILIREKRLEIYKECLKFLKTRVDLDLALFKDDIWAH